MRLIIKIARNELRYLFYSPIAWFVIIVFLLQCVIPYANAISAFAGSQELYRKNSPGFTDFGSSITYSVFIANELFESILQRLYLFIPLLTMGLISREQNDGSIKLLYSSPVKMQQLVLGKYLGILLFNLILVLVIGIVIVFAFVNIKNVDYGMLLSAALCFYLVICMYSAIGLFMSGLSSYQIISAMGVFIVIFILSYIGTYWQRYDFFRDITWFLSVQGRTQKMIRGLIVSRDIFYLLLVSVMFVAFTLIRLSGVREAKAWYVSIGRYAVVLIVILMTGYISSRPTLTAYWDTTNGQKNSVHPKLQKIIRDLGDSTLEVTLFTNMLDNTLGYGMPEARNAVYLNFWEPYLRFKPDIKFRYVYYFAKDTTGMDSLLRATNTGSILKRRAEKIAEMIGPDLGIVQTQEQIDKMVNLRKEGYTLIMQLKYKGKTEWLRTYLGDPFFWPDQQNMYAAIKRLTSQPPKVYFTTGQLQRSIYKTGEREFSIQAWNRKGLSNIGFDVDTIDLETQELPDSADMLVVADPKRDLGTTVQNKLRKYLEGGGNMLLTGHPKKQHVLNPIMNLCGQQLMPGQLVMPTYHETPEKVISYVTAEEDSLSEGLSGVKEQLAGRDTLGIVMSWATALHTIADSSYKISRFLMTLPGRAWIRSGALIIDSTLPPFNAVAGDLKEPSFITGMQLRKQVNAKEQRIILLGGTDLLSNKWNSISTTFYSWLNYRENPVYMEQKASKDALVNISEAGAGVQSIFLKWILPGMFLITGIIILIRRKRK